MEKRKFDISSVGLHVIAMVLMLMDHMWATVFTNAGWLTAVGRLAFPIFAFMIVEGFSYTKNLKKYAIRMILFALISEIPFNLVVANSVFYPLHQNVLLTFLIGFGLIWINEKAKDRKTFARILVAAITVVMGYILGIISFCDYYSAGVLTVLVFYFFRGRKWWNFVLQALCLWYINTEILSGFYYEWNIFGMEIEVLRQSFAMFALVPIWLYKGKQGFYNKGIKALYYLFYPAHLFVLWMIREIIA